MKYEFMPPNILFPGKNDLFNKWFWDDWISTHERKNLDPDFPPDTKRNSKWIKHLNVRVKTIKLLGENRTSV